MKTNIIFLLLSILPVMQISVSGQVNLLQNSGFKNGTVQPDSWTTFPPAPSGLSYIWDDGFAHQGDKSVCIDNTGVNFGMWQQIVDVIPGTRSYDLIIFRLIL